MAREKLKRKAMSVIAGEAATMERCNQNGGVIVEAVSNGQTAQEILIRHRAIAECVLDAYFLRETITEAQYEAGMKFRHAYLRAMLGIKVSDAGVGSHGDYEMSALMPAYCEQVLRTAYAVLSESQRRVVIDICGHDHWAGHSSRTKILIRGLGRLAKHWRMS